MMTRMSTLLLFPSLVENWETDGVGVAFNKLDIVIPEYSGCYRMAGQAGVTSEA